MDMQLATTNQRMAPARRSARPVEYALLLRVVGQELEAKGISTCCVWQADDGFDVLGLSAATANRLVDSGFWQRLTSRRAAAAHSILELHYSHDALVRVDEINRNRRGVGPAISDFLQLSEQLRTLGAIVDRRGGQLLRLDRLAYEGMISSFTLQYRAASGELVTEEFSAPSLYDFSVQIFMMEKRRMRDGRVPRAA
jgi:hypothetical protein